MGLRITPRPGGVPPDLGRPQLPGSKSHTQRALVLAAFAPGTWRIAGPLRSEDTELLAAALEQLGARVRWQGDEVEVRGRPGAGPPDGDLFLGENATGLRLLLAVVPALGGRVRIDGRPGLRARPLEPSLQLLEQLGARVSGNRLPLQVDGSGGRWPAALVVDASTTTQVGSGALLAAALHVARGEPGGSCRVRFALPTAPAYLQVTARVCRQFGWRVEEAAGAGGYLEITVAGRPGDGGEVVVPVDPSARAFPMALGAMHGIDGAAVLPGAEGDPHPDWALDGDLQRLAAAGGASTLEGLAARPDCVPALAAVAASRASTTTFTGLPALRHKESDRLHAMAVGLAAAGVRCEELADGLVVQGPPRPAGSGPCRLPVAWDHRIVMALSLLGTVLPAGVEIGNRRAVAKSWPGFFEWLGRVAVVETI